MIMYSLIRMLINVESTYQNHMFSSASSFNGDLSNWDVSRATSLVSISKPEIDLVYGRLTDNTLFNSGQTVLLLDGEITLNGQTFNHVHEFNLTEDTIFETNGASASWTVI